MVLLTDDYFVKTVVPGSAENCLYIIKNLKNFQYVGVKL